MFESDKGLQATIQRMLADINALKGRGIIDIIEGDNISIDKKNPRKPKISSTASGGGGGGSSYIPPFLKTGGASWSGTGLVYDVTTLEYYFNGDKTTSATQVTLDASDPVNNRLDAIVVDEAGVVSVIKGDASASPISPSVDESHILVQYILVEAGSTQPTIAKEDIYLENVEWTTSTYTTGTATGSIDFDNAVSPKQGVKCISANADARLGARFVRTTSFDPYQYTMLSMWVRFTGSNVATNKSLNVRFENGAGALVANTINLFNFGLQRNLLNVWQLVVIPITSFGALPTSVKGLKIIMAGGTVGQARQWDIDLISLTDNSVPAINEQVFNVLKDGALVGQSSSLNFKGGAVNVTKDVTGDKIDVEVIGGGGIESIVAGTNITIDNTDPLNPIINGSSLLFPNGREIITSSRDFQQSDEGKILIVVGNNIALTMPDASIWTEVGIPIGLKFMQGYTGCSYETAHGLPTKVLQLSSDGEFITVITGEYLGKSSVGTIANMQVNSDGEIVTLNKYLYDKVNASGGTPAGSDTQIQYNNAGSFGASSDFIFDQATSTFTATNNWEVFRTKITFASGGGTNDLTASDATAFTGTPPTTFAVLAFGNIQIVNYINLVGGNFNQGDTITGSVSGAEGYVAYDDGVGQFYVSITNSIQFAATDVIDNANGVTADYDTSTTSDDIFFWFSTNGGSGGPIVITGTAQTLNDGIDITFGSTTGHGAGDSWEWSYKTQKNTVLSNRKIGSGIFGGAINGSYFKSGSGSSTIQAINGFFQNDDDDRIFPLSAYEDLTSGNNADKERAYYGFNPFKGDQTNPLEFVVKTQKGVGPGPGTTEISTLTVGTLSGFEFISDKSFQVSTPLFVTQGSLFSWTGDTNGNGITIDDTNSTATLGNQSGGNNTKITIDDVNEHITISNLPAYDDDTAAGVGGLTAGMVYMTTGSGSAPLNAAGILMIKQ